MKEEIKSIHPKVLIKRIGIVFIAFEICRLLFVLFNYRHLSSPGTAEIIWCLFYGIRFDFPVILLFNLLFIVLHIFPNQIWNRNRYQLLLKIIFLAINIPLILCNIIDVFLYRFTLSRATTRELYIFETREPMGRISWSIVETYWYGFIMLFIFIYAVGKIYSAIPIAETKNTNEKKQGLLLTILALSVLVSCQGTFRAEPVSSVTAAEIIGSRQAAVILNTPFTFFFDAFRHPDGITDMNLVEAEKNYPVEKCFSKSDSLKRMNVVVILLESFSAQYVGALNGGNGFTPFLDSLSKNSLLLTHCYANGKVSIQGIPSVLSALPSWSDRPFIASRYNSDRVNSFASLLKPLGYSSAFFHGGENGTMNFDLYAKAAGYQKYYGMNEYPDAENKCGTWGIDDEPFLQFAKHKMDSMHEPFHAAVFTLSSHHPFHVPESAKKKFPEKEDPIVPTVYYTDDALREFFEEASKTSWYKNTIFVFCADHTGPYQREKHHSEEDNYHIFAMIYSPSEYLSGRFENTTQQTDLLPSVLDHLNYSGKFVAFGNSIFDSSQKRISVHCLNETYTIIDSVFDLQYCKGWKSFWVSGKETSSENKREREDEQLLKAVIKNYNYRVEKNRLATDL